MTFDFTLSAVEAKLKISRGSRPYVFKNMYEGFEALVYNESVGSAQGGLEGWVSERPSSETED